ncbi:MAG: hypothetical protein IKI45_10410 [Oscillospiraceae bacterium]|nr:hypothetical protein [Oscillospiraceae bacterium]
MCSFPPLIQDLKYLSLHFQERILCGALYQIAEADQVARVAEQVNRVQIQTAADLHIAVQLTAAGYHIPHRRYHRLLIRLCLFLRKLHLLRDFAHIRTAAFEIVNRNRRDRFLNVFAFRAVFLVDDSGHICRKAFVQSPEIWNASAVCLGDIEEVTASAVLTEYSDAAFSAVDHSAEPVPCFQYCNLCRIGVLLKNKGSIGEGLLIHPGRKPQEIRQKLLVMQQAVRDLRPVVEDGIVSAQDNRSFLAICCCIFRKIVL